MVEAFEESAVFPETHPSYLLEPSAIFVSQRDWRLDNLEMSEVLATSVRQYDVEEQDTSNLGHIQRPSRELIRGNRDYITQMGAVTFAVSRIMVERGEDLSEDAAYAILRPLFRPGADVDILAKPLASTTAQHALMRTKVTVACRELNTKVAKDIEESPEAQYDLLKFLAATEPDYPDTDQYSASSFHTLMFFDEHVSQKNNIVVKLRTALEAGRYDRHILGDILRLSEVDALPESFQSLKRSWQFIKGISGSTNTEDLIVKVLLAQEYWPSEIRMSVDSQRRDLLVGLDGVSEGYRNTISYYGCMPKSQASPEEELAFTIENFKTALYNDARAPQLFTREEIVRAGLKKRGRRPISSQEQGSTATEVETIAEPRKTHYLHGTTFISDAEHPNYRDTVRGFVSKHGNTVEATDDVLRMIEYARRIDFSKGLVRGIKVYNWDIIINGKSLPVHALKPSEAVGLPIKTKVARQSRLLFAVDNGNLYVLTIDVRNSISMVQSNWVVKEAVTA